VPIELRGLPIGVLIHKHRAAVARKLHEHLPVDSVRALVLARGFLRHWIGIVSRFTLQCRVTRHKRLTSRVSVRDLVPESHFVLVELPAQTDRASVARPRKIDKSLLESLEVNAELTQLAQIPLDLSGQAMHLFLERRQLRGL